jgi:hypothetical protein
MGLTYLFMAVVNSYNLVNLLLNHWTIKMARLVTSDYDETSASSIDWSGIFRTLRLVTSLKNMSFRILQSRMCELKKIRFILLAKPWVYFKGFCTLQKVAGQCHHSTSYSGRLGLKMSLLDQLSWLEHCRVFLSCTWPEVAMTVSLD